MWLLDVNLPTALVALLRGYGLTVLATLPELAIVVVTLPQPREASHLRAFAEAWRVDRIRPVPGAIIEWPSS